MSERTLDVTGLTTRFQTTIPKRVREILHVTNDDRIVLGPRQWRDQG